MKYFFFFLLFHCSLCLSLPAAKWQSIDFQENKIVAKSTQTHHIQSFTDKPTPPTQIEWKKAMILACLVFVGIGGMHRLYMGYRTEGIIQFATIGLGGIWQIIDIARMITGDLKPKEGEFVMPDKSAKPDKAKRKIFP